MSADLTTEVWRQQWSDFPGGVGDYAPNGKPVEEAGGSLGPLSELESHWLKRDGIADTVSVRAVFFMLSDRRIRN